MTNWPPDRDELTRQLIRIVEIRLLDPIEILLEDGATTGALQRMVQAKATSWAALLLGEDDQAAALTAARLIAALYPGDTALEPPADWWRTPFGRVVAHRLGHPSTQAVSYSVAGAMLGITRQGVHDLVSRGKLARHPDGGVLVTSIRSRLNRDDSRTTSGGKS
ncbi:hypothetical protein [Actinomadura alba]|uniref:DNA-binding protein n=1 Tax=Actinomadura alba TaxID=406431 RepID=A0ABR7M0E4_9ACTN|nr:hypothetical protein [Actinomadura alba]MBC6470584.1 hypothetical protein [Actinomadura alba]